MDTQTCFYATDVPASKDSDEYDRPNDPQWRCPHPPLKEAFGGGPYCVFHTNREVDVRYQQHKLLEALKNIGDSPYENRPEHYGEFVGATFEAIDLSYETIRTPSEYSLRFDNAQFLAKKDNLSFTGTQFETTSQNIISFNGAEFITGDYDADFFGMGFGNYGSGNIEFRNATFRADGRGEIDFRSATLTDGNFQNADFGESNLSAADLTGMNLWGADIEEISVSGATTCKRLYEPTDQDVSERSKKLSSMIQSSNWAATARSYHNLKTVFSNHGLVGKARSMYLQERRAHRFEAKIGDGWYSRQYWGSYLSQIFTGYGVQIQSLVRWMLILFVFSTIMYVNAGVRDTLVGNISYSVLAFTVAPPSVPEGVAMQLMMMVETFFGTLSTVLLGYILGNRERF